jgi:hypothetical protein
MKNSESTQSPEEVASRRLLSPWRTSPTVRSWHLHWLGDAPFTGYQVTGTWGMYCRQTRHYWFGIAGLVNIRRTISWG